MDKKERYINQNRIAGMNCHYRYYTIDDFFSSLQNNNISKAEIWTCASHFLIDQRGWQDTKAFKQKAGDYGIQIICLTPEQNNPKPHNFAAKSKELISRSYDYYTNVVRAAQELECGLISVSSGWAFYSEPVAEAWKRSVEMFQKLSEFALKRGVTLAMETLFPSETRLVTDLNSISRMLRDVNSRGLKVNIDLGSIGTAGETIDQYFKAFGEDIVHCHFVDGTPAGHLAWGDGDRDLKKDLSDFHKNGYKGYLSMELVASRYFEEPEKADRKCMEALNPYFIK